MISKVSLFLLVIVTYSLLFYLQFTMNSKVDFSSFYASAHVYDNGGQPYPSLEAKQITCINKLPTNLNPPIFLLITRLMGKLPYVSAMIIWSILSMICGLIGASIVASLCFTKAFLKKNWPILLFLYVSSFSVMMNIAIGQVGAFMLFFLMLGYHCYLQKHDNLAGILWGIIASIKLFPALLLFFVISESRYRVFSIMLITICTMWFLPIVTDGLTLYKLYFQMLKYVLWYGDGWNASIFGFLFRIFIDPNDRLQSLLIFKLIYLLIFITIMIWYWFKINENTRYKHRSFCLTLVLMLLLSPLGWSYYFPILLLPLVLTWQATIQAPRYKISFVLLWMVCFFMINFPVDYSRAINMTYLFPKISIYSIYFYALLILSYLLISPKTKFENAYKIDSITHQSLLAPLFIIIGFGLLLPLSGFIFQLIHLAI